MKMFLLRRLTQLLGLLAVAAGLASSANAQMSDQALTMANPRVKEIIPVQNRVTGDLMKLPEILGTAVGQADDGEISLLVFVNTQKGNPSEVMRALPHALHGVRVVGRLTDPIIALGGKPGSGAGTTTTVSPRALQTLPIKLGTSGGWAKDLANGYCCGGTLGSLIQVTSTGKKYILSNYHVLESDIVIGGNGATAADGDPVVQPGLIDVGCNAANAQTVAVLKRLGSLPNSNVDVGVAEIASENVVSGQILGVGNISASTTSAAVGKAVKKSGRTTGLTRSTIAGLNATVSISYENECAGGSAFTKTFTGQIVINNKGSKFLAGGDSGSLMVEDVAVNPRAIGLLFAGSSFYGFANPIDEVLSVISLSLGGTASMVGN